MATSKEEIISLSKGNIFDIFGGKTTESRLAELQKQWHPSGKIIYTDPFSVATTHEEIEAVIVRMNGSLPGSVFTTTGDVEILTQAGDVSVSRITWGLGPPGEEFKVKGTDIITITAGKIERCYTFLDK